MAASLFCPRFTLFKGALANFGEAPSLEDSAEFRGGRPFWPTLFFMIFSILIKAHPMVDF